MPRSIPEMIRGDFKCDDIAKCILGLKNIDIETYKILVTKGPMTAEKLGELLSRERSTAYRSLQSLMGCGLVHRETRSIAPPAPTPSFTSPFSYIFSPFILEFPKPGSEANA